jgi:protein TonB
VSLTFEDRESQRAVFRWTACALVVVGVHVMGAVLLRAWQVPLAPPEVAPASIIMDLEPAPAPVPAPQEAPPPEPPPEEQPAKAESAEPPPPPPAVVPEVVLPQVTPKAKPRPPKPVEHKRIERLPPQPAVTSPAAAPPRPAPAPAVPADAMAQFQHLLSAHLEREKRYPRSSQQHHEQGTVLLRFTMDRAGKVLAASIERGSGFAALDDEVLAMIRRAQPLPALPPEITAGQLELVVAIKFSLR